MSTRRVSIMQPYLFPYVGYFQLIAKSDEFVIYDDIKYTKKGWINRNRILLNGAARMFTAPLAAASDELDIRDRTLASDWQLWRAKFLRQLEGAYHVAPQRRSGLALAQQALDRAGGGLFELLAHALRCVLDWLDLRTRVTVSSSLGVARSLHGQARVIETCHRLSATHYLNPPGGRALYEPETFAASGLQLEFLEPALEPYAQAGGEFVPALSILDLCMWLPREQVRAHVLLGRSVAAGGNFR